MKPVEGAAHKVSYTALGLGGPECTRSFLLGGQSDSFNLGQWSTNFKAGSRNFTCFDPVSSLIPVMGTGIGFAASCGPLPTSNRVNADFTGVGGLAMIPGTMAQLTALAGPAALTGGISASVTGAAIASITSAFVKVNTVGFPGGVVTDGSPCGLLGRPMITGGTIGCPTFRV